MVFALLLYASLVLVPLCRRSCFVSWKESVEQEKAELLERTRRSEAALRTLAKLCMAEEAAPVHRCIGPSSWGLVAGTGRSHRHAGVGRESRDHMRLWQSGVAQYAANDNSAGEHRQVGRAWAHLRGHFGTNGPNCAMVLSH